MVESTFKKPKRVVIDALGYLSEVLKDGVKKDLQDHQKLCSMCKGTGLMIINQVYGLSNDPDKSKHFPYSNQYIAGCNHCYSGVINLCEHCNNEPPRFTTNCNCEKAKSVQNSLQLEKERERWRKTIKLEHDNDIAKGMGMYYSENYSRNEGYFSEWEDFIDSWYDDNELDAEKPLYVWGTSCIKLSFDADSIIESACDDLHEEVGSNIVDQDELQELLDKWCEKQTGTESYYEDYKYAIKIPW